MPALHEAFERIGAFLERRMPLMHAPGAALAVTDRDDILGVVVRGFADAASGTPVRPDTRFQIGSISKSFAAMIAVQEAEAGRLDLHAPVADLVPWLELRQPYGPITLHHLLTHSSGLPTGTDESADAMFAAWHLRTVDPGFAPGERFHYSNLGYKLVGLVLEHTTRRSIRELLRERILEPLGMKDTSPAITADERRNCATGYATLYGDRPGHREHPLVPAPWTDGTTADGSIVSNVIAMSAYARMVLARGGGLVSEEGFDLLTRAHIRDQDDPAWSYGYGWWVGEENGRAMVFHSGGMVGYQSYLPIEPDSGLAAIMLLNGAGIRADVAEFALNAVRAALAGDPLPEVGPAPDPLAVPNAGEYAGRYVAAGRVIQLTAANGGLRLVDGETSVELERDPTIEADDVFLVPREGMDLFALRFERDGARRVVAASHGPEWFAREGSGDPAGTAEHPRLPAEWEPFVGHYRSWNPWVPGFRVVARRGRLVFVLRWVDDDVDLQLVPLDDGSFRVGPEPWQPGRIQFDAVVEGRALRARYDDGTWYRWFEE